jgi:hypothetical protein
MMMVLAKVMAKVMAEVMVVIITVFVHYYQGCFLQYRISSSGYEYYTRVTKYW